MKAQPQEINPPSVSRRRVPRRGFEAPVGVLYKGKFQMQRSFQVGEGGMMINSEVPLVEGEHVVVSFFLTSGTLIMVRGAVRTSIAAKGNLPIRYGLEFLNLGFQFKREIRNFVAAATRVDGHVGA